MAFWFPKTVNKGTAQYKKRIGILSLLIAILFNTFAVPPTTANATIAKYINFQGKLTQVSGGTNVADGVYAVRFKLYDALTSGTLLWTETFDNASSVDPCYKRTVTSGVFNAKLGACASLASIDFTGGALYLSVDVNITGSYDGEMTPRKQLVAAPFAFVANGVSGDGTVNSTVSSATALTVAKAGSNYGLQVDTSAASAATGVKITSAAAAGGIALAAISSGTDENITIDAKGAGTVSIGATSTGNILFGGGSGSTGCTLTNSTGAFACTAAITGSNLSGTNTGDQTITLTGDVTGSGTGSFATTIGADKVLESNLKAVDSASDEECLTYETTTGDFEWQTCTVVTADSLDFIDFEDTLDLDAALVLNQGTNTWTQNFTGTTTVGSAYTASSITTGTALSLVGPTSTGVTTGASSGFLKVASDVGSAGTGGTLAYFAPDYSAGTAATSYGLSVNGTDSTTVSNNNYNVYSNLAMSNDATSKWGAAFFGNVTSSSTLADSTFGGYFGTTASGAISSGARGTYGVYSSPSSSGANSGGTTNLYGIFSAPNSYNSTTGSTVNVYGSYTSNQALLTTGGTINSYGNYIGNGSMNTTGTSTQYGLYVENQTGADNNYTAVFAGGNVGIGTTTPTAFLHVGSNGAASNPGLKLSGSWFTGGDSTTTKPQALIEASGASSTGWSTNGTGLGVNAPSGFAGRMIDVKLNGTSAFALNEAGGISILGQGVTNIGAANAYWYQAGATVSIGNNGDTGASNLLLRAGVSGSSGGNITFNVNDSNTGIWNSAGLGIGTGTPIDPLSISTAINASATHALFNLSNTALSGGSANGTYIGANPAAFTGNFFDFQVASSSVAKLTSGGALTVTSCTGCGGGSTTFDAIGDPAGNGAINMGTTVQTLDWGATTTTDNLSITSSGTGVTSGSVLKVTSASTGAVSNGLIQFTASGAYTSTGGLLNVTGNSTASGTLAKFSATALTTGTALTIAGGTAMTTGSVLGVSSATYNHASGETGNMTSLIFSDATTTAGAVTSTTNGLNIASTVATTTSTSGTKTVNAINIASPTLTSCTGGASCVWNGVQITAPATTASFTTTGLKVVADSITTNGDSAMSISAAALTTGQALKITAGGTTQLTSGAGLLVTGPTGAAAIANGLVQATATGNYTGTGGLLNVLATTSTAGTLVNFTNNTASFTGTGVNISTTGLSTGSALQITGGGSMAGGGQLLGLTMGTAGAGNALNITANGGTYTGTGLQTFNSNSLTSGTILSIAANGSSQTTAKYIDIAQTGTTTGFTGNLINLSSSSTTGAATFINLAANSSTVGVGQAISMTALTTGSALTITGPSSTGVTGSGILKVTSDVGSGGTQGMLAAFNPDYSSASAASGYGVAIQGTDSTTAANTDNNLYSNLALTGNAAKTGYASYNNVSSNSTTADTTYGGLFSTNITGAISTGTRNTYGFLAQPATSGANTGGTTQLFGGYFAPNSTGSTTGSTVNVFGNYVSNTATLTTNGTINSYGLYVADGTSSTTGTSTKYGIYVVSPTGADTNVAAYFGGNVGIGTTTPTTANLVVNSTTADTAHFVNTQTSGTGAGASIFTASNDGAAMASGDRLGSFLMGGASDGASTMIKTAGMLAFAEENWTGSSTASYLRFETTPTGTTTRSERMRIDSVGAVGIGASMTAPKQPNGIQMAYSTNAGQKWAFISGESGAYLDGNSYFDGSWRYLDGANGASMVNPALGVIRFYTTATTGSTGGVINNWTEKMEIDGSGNVLIGTTTQKGLLTVAQTNAANDEAIYIDTEESTTTQQVFAIESDTSTADTVKMYITAEGEIKVKLNGQVDPVCETSGVIGNCSSDARLKTNIVDLGDNMLDKIMQLQPRYFDWLNSDRTHVPGFIAQEVIGAIPETFSGYTGDGYLKFSKDTLIPYLTRALQELNQISIKTNPNGTINRESFVFEMPEDAANTAQITGTGNQAVATTGFVINQKGSGNIIQLQQDGIDKLLIANDGSLHISTNLASGFVMEVKNADTTLLTINTKGTAVLTGTLVVKKDIAVLGTVLGSTSVIAKNTSDSPIHQGDVVYLTGATDAVFGEQPTITVAAATENEKDKVIVGIADRNLSDFNLDESAPVSADPTTINPGEYLNIVITGSFKMAAATTSNANISTGDKLTLSSTAGKLRKLNPNENAPVVGVALDALSTNTGSVRVLLLASSANTIIQNIVNTPTPTPPPTSPDPAPPTEETPPTPDPTIGDASPPTPLP